MFVIVISVYADRWLAFVVIGSILAPTLGPWRSLPLHVLLILPSDLKKSSVLIVR